MRRLAPSLLKKGGRVAGFMGILEGEGWEKELEFDFLPYARAERVRVK